MHPHKKILFLTDLHFREDVASLVRNNFRKMEKAIRDHHLESQICDVVITGDISCTGAEADYRQALAAIRHLTEEVLKIIPEHIHICPGNHDADDPEKAGGFTYFEAFLRELYQDGKSEEDCIQYTMINSCTRCVLQEPNHAVLTEEDEKKCREAANHSGIKILGMHHQPEVFANREILESLLLDFEMVLYGHTHLKHHKFEKQNGTIFLNGCAFHAIGEDLASAFYVIEIGEQVTVTEYKDNGKTYEIVGEGSMDLWEKNV